LVLGCAAGSIPQAKSAPSGGDASSPALRLASTRWAPFTDVEGQPRFATEVVSAGLARAGYRVSHHILPDGRVTSAVEERVYDGSAAMWPSPERAQFLLYSEPYLENRMVLVGPKGSVVSAATFAQLAGKKIGIVEGYAYGPELEQAKEPVFVRGESDEQNLRALLAGELDYVLEDALVVHHLIEEYPKQTQERLEIAKTAMFKRSLHLTLHKDVPDAAQIIERFNAELKRMQADGSYNAALGVGWIRADVDGDGRLELIHGREGVGTQPPSGGYDLISIAPAGAAAGDHGPVRFLIEGVYYDTWDAVPEQYKRDPGQLDPKPGTLRVKVFEF